MNSSDDTARDLIVPTTETVTRVAKLVADPKNRRAHPTRNLDMVRESLLSVGAGRSLVIDEDDMILAGNGVAAAAAAAGITNVRIIEATGAELIAVRRRGLTAEQKRALALYDNRTAELSEWNFDQLDADKDAGLSLQPFWTAEEEAALLGRKVISGRTDPDDLPELRRTDITLGDLFELGSHRVLCGDTTRAADVARLMYGEVAQLVFTDPPYGVAYEGGMKKRRALKNDHVGTAIYEQSLPQLAHATDAEAALYLWYADSYAAAAAAAGAGYEVVAQIIWSKNHAQFVSAAHYKGKHEACLYAHKRGKAARWYGPNNEVTLWECDRAPSNEFHPTQKPVALAVRAISNSTQPAQLVLDGFCGGGTTLIACEQLGRSGRAVELDPQYVQVTIDRWEAFTGKTAVKVGAA